MITGPLLTYASWVEGVGWSLTMSSLWFIPAYAIHKFFKAEGTWR